MLLLDLCDIFKVEGLNGECEVGVGFVNHQHQVE